MISGKGDISSRSNKKGSATKLKILSRKAGLGESDPTKNFDPSGNSPSKNFTKNFRINQSKISESKMTLDRKGSYPLDIPLERNTSSSRLYFNDAHAQRRPSGFPNYLVSGPPRRYLRHKLVLEANHQSHQV